jgi:hypothetical protein
MVVWQLTSYRTQGRTTNQGAMQPFASMKTGCIFPNIHVSRKGLNTKWIIDIWIQTFNICTVYESKYSIGFLIRIWNRYQCPTHPTLSLSQLQIPKKKQLPAFGIHNIPSDLIQCIATSMVLWILDKNHPVMQYVNKQQDSNYHDQSYIWTTQPMFIRTCQMSIMKLYLWNGFFITSHKPLKDINCPSMYLDRYCYLWLSGD